MRTASGLAWLSLSFCLVAACGRGLDPTAQQEFQQAQAAFDAARSPNDYLLAASRFEKISASGVRSGAVFFNQGNAYMRGGQRGRAIACYRLAQRYRPGDPYLESNLRTAFGATPSGLPQPLIESLLFWQNWISVPNKFRISLWAAAITCGLALTSTVWPTATSRRAALATLAISVVLVFSTVYDWYRFEHLKHGVVVVKETIARKGDATSYEPAFTTPLGEGTEFVVVELRRDWVLGRASGGQEGWIALSDAVLY